MQSFAPQDNKINGEFYKDGEPTSGWIHCSYSRNKNRQQWLRAMREDGKVNYKPWLE